ncbi:glutathione-dependent reductase [Secundilactobacillus paracollinoides]|uniref:glutathione S-transferase C-terminal domain-containing protein n=1 Tax=Secundilactobacillus paracollinoides TaxID=240427 RepID=UPI00081A659F|nr:glutathione S-transferase C-terminal domain-containing protein [Secundilactobacillus paracollinoides]ANZ64545.1 glutathione-dependent reductase [Secundilactobacillus paracollinoides]
MAKEAALQEELSKIDVNEKLSACPIDFSRSKVANPRAGQKSKDYVSGETKSNFNDRKKFQPYQEPQFNQLFTDGTLPVEANRYRLIWSRHCPWASRLAIAIDLLGLDNVISKGVVDPLRPAGVVGDWFFTLDDDDEDPVLHTKSLSESYLKADPNYTLRTTVPTLVDVKTGKVVNNNYNTLIDEFSIAWQRYQDEDVPDLYPEELREDIDALNKIIYTDVNTAVNEAGLARSQVDYEKYYNRVFNRLDWLEERLSKQRYLFGSTITDTDIRLYVTLARFDVVFYQKYYVNKKRLVDYPNLWNYTKDLYSLPAFKNNTDFDAIKKRFYQVDHTPQFDLPRIIPNGPDLSIWTAPNDRNRFEA